MRRRRCHHTHEVHVIAFDQFPPGVSDVLDIEFAGDTLGVITITAGNGNYLWQPSYQAGQPETLLGRPVVELIDMPDVAADAPC